MSSFKQYYQTQLQSIVAPQKLTSPASKTHTVTFYDEQKCCPLLQGLCVYLLLLLTSTNFSLPLTINNYISNLKNLVIITQLT